MKKLALLSLLLISPSAFAISVCGEVTGEDGNFWIQSGVSQWQVFPSDSIFSHPGEVLKEAVEKSQEACVDGETTADEMGIIAVHANLN